MSYEELLQRTSAPASAYLEQLKERPVARPADFAELLAQPGGEIPAQGEDALQVVEHLAEAAAADTAHYPECKRTSRPALQCFYVSPCELLRRQRTSSGSHWARNPFPASRTLRVDA